MKRGDIYVISIPYATGREMRKNRPGVIVSGGETDRLEVVQVVMCSGSNEHALGTHVRLRSTPRPSRAMCEHIYTVDLSRLGKCLGHVTEDEMAEIDRALMTALGLGREGR